MEEDQPKICATLEKALGDFGTALRAELVVLRAEVQSELHSMQQQIQDIAAKADTVIPKEKMTAADVTTAQEDMHSIKGRLATHLSLVSTWTAPDVGIAAYLFFFMIEVAWTLLFFAAGGPRPEPLSKTAATPCSFKVPVRDTNAKKYDLPRPLKELAPDAREKLVLLLTQWSPHKGKDGTIAYNKVAYWLHALRLVRDVGTHRSLALVVRPPPEPELGPRAGLQVKLPMSPAASEAQPLYSHKSLPAFGVDALKFQEAVANSGYCYVTAEEMAKAIEAVAHIVCDGLFDVLDACRPKD